MHLILPVVFILPSQRSETTWSFTSPSELLRTARAGSNQSFLPVEQLVDYDGERLGRQGVRTTTGETKTGQG